MMENVNFDSSSDDERPVRARARGRDGRFAPPRHPRDKSRHDDRSSHDGIHEANAIINHRMSCPACTVYGF